MDLKNEEFTGESCPIDPPFGKLASEEYSNGFVYRSYQLSDEWHEAMRKASSRSAEADAMLQSSANDFTGLLVIGGFSIFLAILIFVCGFTAGMAAQ